MTQETFFPGVMNFRDVGGLPAGAGQTRSGVLFRSGNLVGITDPAALAGFGVRAVIDLRDDDEVAHAPSNVGDVPILRVPLFLGSTASFFDADLTLAQMYRTMVDDSADRVVRAVRGVLETQPVLVHCTVGKDRTGVTVALALAAAGVEREAIISDYARTASLLPEERNRAVVAHLRSLYPRSANIVELATLSPAAAMRALLSDLDERYGSPTEYLRAHGVQDDEIAEFARILVVER